MPSTSPLAVSSSCSLTSKTDTPSLHARRVDRESHAFAGAFSANTGASIADTGPRCLPRGCTNPCRADGRREPLAGQNGHPARRRPPERSETHPTSTRRGPCASVGCRWRCPYAGHTGGDERDCPSAAPQSTGDRLTSTGSRHFRRRLGARQRPRGWLSPSARRHHRVVESSLRDRRRDRCRAGRSTQGRCPRPAVRAARGHMRRRRRGGRSRTCDTRQYGTTTERARRTPRRARGCS